MKRELTQGQAAKPAAPTAKMTGAEEVGVVLVTRIGLIVGGLAIQSLLAYTLLPEGRGAYAVCVTFGGLFGALFSLGADRGIQYFLMAKRISVSESVWVALIICTAGSAIAIAFAVPLISSDIPFFQKADRASFHLSLPLIPLTAFSTSLQLQLAGLRRFGRLALFSVLHTVSNFSILVVLIFGLDMRVEGALIGAAIGHGVMISAMLIDLRLAYGLHATIPSRIALRRILRYGMQYHLARMGQVVDVQIGALFLAMVAGRAEIGIFTVASVLLTRVSIISEAVSSAVLPRVATESGGRPALVSLCGRLTSWLTGAALVILCATSVPLTRVLLSEAFLPSVRLMLMMAPAILLYSGASVLMSYFRGINRPSVCSWVVWAGLIGNLATVTLLYPHAGVAAAAWGVAAGRVCRSAVIVTAFARASHSNPMCIWFPQRGDAERVWALGRKAITRVIPWLSSGT